MTLSATLCTMSEQTFGDRVRDQRERMELTQPIAAKKAGVAVGTWRNTENAPVDSKPPHRLTVRKIAKVLGWPPDRALRWAGYDEPSADVVPAPRTTDGDHSEEITRLLRDLPHSRGLLVLYVVRATCGTKTPRGKLVDHVDPDLAYGH